MDWTKRLLILGAFLAGFLLVEGHAWADSENVSGNAVGASLADGSYTVQTAVCGNAVGVIGDPRASCGGEQDGGNEPPGGGNEPPGGGNEPPGGGNEPPGGGNEPSFDGGVTVLSAGLPSPGTLAFTGDNLFLLMVLAVGLLLIGARFLALGKMRIEELVIRARERR